MNRKAKISVAIHRQVILDMMHRLSFRGDLIYNLHATQKAILDDLPEHARHGRAYAKLVKDIEALDDAVQALHRHQPAQALEHLKSLSYSADQVAAMVEA